MTLTDLKNNLATVDQLSFILPTGEKIPPHFHITEMGVNTKNFIDCGGTIRTEKKIVFQLWYANDTDHRLNPKTYLGIIRKAEKHLPIEDLTIAFEFQGKTIETYGAAFKNGAFHLLPTFTDCLAKDGCGIEPVKTVEESCCTPESNCC